ncbi:MAG: GNAT family N-acetyltransferase [Promethearchaeota archaeon]
MIQEISVDNINDIRPLIERYNKQGPEVQLPENFAEQVKTSISENKACFYGAYSDHGSIRGIALFGRESKRINFVFADGDLETEKLLITALFDRFSQESPYIAAGGLWISEDLAEHIQSIGFGRHDRMHMSLSREDIEVLDDPTLPDGMSFEPYCPELREEICEVVFDGNDGHVDQNIFPEFFGTVDACRSFLENIETNRYGEYRDALSWILRRDGRAIGACFMTVRNGDMGYIPDIVVNKEFRGQKLGRAILVHSMKRLLESDSDLIKIELDVTLSNIARFLYESLGFTKLQEYTLYTWKKSS